MKKSDRPSELFIGSIMRAYDKAHTKEPHKPVTCSELWNGIVMECFRQTGGFEAMFAWDTSTAQHINRIGTIQECIERGYVPGLRLTASGKRLIVERC